MDTLGIIVLIVIIILLFLFIRCFRIVPQAHVFVIERLGSFHAQWETGLHILVPFIDRIAGKVSLKEKVVDFKPQPVITKDNVTMQIDTVVFYQVTDAKQYIYGVERPLAAIENLSATTLRNIIGEMELDATLTSRDVINTKITSILDQATDRWGIKVNRVELKNILPPREIQDAMEKQMKAERERREKILQAEGDKKSQILVAEGEKESQILRAQAKKEAQILEAEAQKQAMVLRADAVREQKILEATGEAKAIEMVQQALAESIVKLNNANPNERVIQLKSLESFAKAADGKATKIIIPSEIQGLAGLATGLKAIVEKDTAPAAPAANNSSAGYQGYNAN
ncbi:SPFH domain-containing protein [Ruminococcus flavefaciens]|jgi:regulator of protease activity HflC (stomatin/prohibitin superfamily)|uniref:SPFH domain-containing protein n=1 Tax=Ruminococcus flavefaciens TaxID=1265 RepID=UPI0013DB8F0F|nr:SPFH domain-containing protein [Ruminococcus flavefaciens]